MKKVSDKSGPKFLTPVCGLQEDELKGQDYIALPTKLDFVNGGSRDVFGRYRNFDWMRCNLARMRVRSRFARAHLLHAITSALRIRPGLVSGWECRGRRLSSVKESLRRWRGPGRGRHWHPLPAMFSPLKHWRELIPDALARPSSSSRQYLHGREFSETLR